MRYFVDHVFNYPTLAECYKVAALAGLNKLGADRRRPNRPCPRSRRYVLPARPRELTAAHPRQPRPEFPS